MTSLVPVSGLLLQRDRKPIGKIILMEYMKDDCYLIFTSAGLRRCNEPGQVEITRHSDLVENKLFVRVSTKKIFSPNTKAFLHSCQTNFDVESHL